MEKEDNRTEMIKPAMGRQTEENKFPMPLRQERPENFADFEHAGNDAPIQYSPRFESDENKSQDEPLRVPS